MIERIVQFSIAQRYLVLTIAVLLGMYGFYSLTHLPIDAVPDVTNNQIQINTVVEGLGPVEMEKQVTFPVENALAGIPGLKETRSLSRYGFSQVTAVFHDHVNVYFARQQINERLNEVRDDLPKGAEPRMGPISTGLSEVYMWTVEFAHPAGVDATQVAGKPGWQPDGSYLTPERERLRDEGERAAYLRTVQDWIIAPQLKSVPGLAGVDAIGGYVKQYQVEPDPSKLIALGISFGELREAIEDNNISLGAGYIEQNGEAFLVKADARIASPKEIEDIVITTRDSLPIHVRDVAEVVIGREPRSGAGTENGREVVIGTAMMLIGANSRTVANTVAERLQEVNTTLPPDVQAKPVLTRTKLINATVHTVVSNLAEGAILVIAVLFAFLGNVRAALLTAAIIPLSMLMTAIGMVQSQISGNLMSLGAIDFGLIVDGGVIIAENCLRHLSEKQHEKGATLSLSERLTVVAAATKEMIAPTVFGQAIIITVYLPLLTLSGVEGKMFEPMALTVMFALVSAFLLSVTFTPAMIALFVTGKVQERENTLIAKAKTGYVPVLKAVLRNPWTTITASLILVTGSFVLYTQLGQEFVPQLDELDIAVQAKRIPGTSLDQSVRMQFEVEKTIKKFPEVAFVYSKTGTAQMASDPMAPEDSDTFVILKPRSEWPDPALLKEELIGRFEEALQQLPGNSYEFTQPIQMRFNELIAGVKSDVAVKVRGDDFTTLQKVSDDIAKVLRKVPGAADVQVEQTDGLPVLDIQLDRDALSRHGLNTSDVLNVVSIAIGGEKAGVLREGDRHYNIVVRLPDSVRNDMTALANLPVAMSEWSKAPAANRHTDTGLRPYLPLKEVADLQESEGLYAISRENGKRQMVVGASVRGNDLGTFVTKAKKEIASKVKIPPGYWLDWGGQYENLISAKERLVIVVPVCFALILLLLFTAFDSLKQALLVFTGVPLALTGGIVALWLRDMPFSISAAVGFIALSGIAVLNGLVLVTSINQLAQRGLDLAEAITKGALNRVRPVLITALVASLGFLPMALATGAGAEVQKPIATVVIGGLISSTLLTLVVLPSLYLVFCGLTQARARSEPEARAKATPA